MSRLIVIYVLAAALLPPAIFWASFFAVCAIECTALPWLSLLIGPGLALIAVIVIGIWVLKKAKILETRERRTVWAVVISSVLWGPIVSSLAFGWVLKLVGAMSATF